MGQKQIKAQRRIERQTQREKTATHTQQIQDILKDSTIIAVYPSELTVHHHQKLAAITQGFNAFTLDGMFKLNNLHASVLVIQDQISDADLILLTERVQDLARTLQMPPDAMSPKLYQQLEIVPQNNRRNV